MKQTKTFINAAATAASRSNAGSIGANKARSLIVLPILGATLLGLLSPAAADTYDLSDDWSISANPNGPWTYGRMNTALAFAPFTAVIDAAYLGDFFGPQPAWDGQYPMVLGKSTGTSGLDFPLGRVGGHMSNEYGLYMAVKWTAPAAGTLNISGGLWMFRDIGRRALASLYINNIAVFDDVLIPPTFTGCSSSATFSLSDAMIADGRSPGALLEIAVQAGDTVVLAVRKTAESPYGDYVGMDFTLDLSTGSPPVATDDYYGMVQASSLSVSSPGILANDSDPNNDPLTVELISSPVYASAFQLNADGSFAYTPNLSFSGEDSFSYRIFDGGEYSNPATVHITVTQPGAQGFVTGGGKFLQCGRKCTFGFAAKVEGGGVQGNLEFKDHLAGVEVISLATDWVYTPNQTDGYFSGTCSMNGMSGYTYFVQVRDMGQPGNNDEISIWVYDEFNSLVYSAGANLTGGNIVIHGN